MLKELRAGEKVTGAKQARRAIRDGLARQVFLASDADPALIDPLLLMCREKGIPVCGDYPMARLGAAAGIQVGAAVVTLLEKN